ncbi:acyl-CoA/acyl-ACP dehydrogenase [Mycobacterium sp. CVI_P3]|uniref:Acyl-CoA/acyl-ACP dehydrogenase n=1 Tax=Mycobacterium pinniadriaticum TaxID=2994102 RepID=A0ABT3SBG2_9MYCO|nr:acyl-CoA dehydrogenase family protein [Mycobacterium pinniadriaticum]MCX2929888.1 acyl-CoA/acyl-ACP dehydrogenase [Mycobacterium pinniadriaticum]MCX2936463.1 acyl-CoA/acyl-ACP dehydrogenase [Mycobacterium pinniadriaticum]
MVAQLSHDQQSLRELAREFLARRADDTLIRSVMDTPTGFDQPLWDEFAGLGLCGLAVPARYGGVDCGPAEVAIVMGELGRRLVPMPYFSTVGLAQNVLLHSDDDAACERLLPLLATGQRRATVALVEPAWNWDPMAIRTTASPLGEGWCLTGAKTFVVDGATADSILVAARGPDGIGIYEVDGTAPGLTRAALTTIDHTRRLGRVEMDATPARAIGRADAGLAILRQALTVANVYLAAESVGGTEHVLDSSVEYAKNRVQFGRPIGSFQAVKHKCSDMYLDLETSRATVEHAIRTLGSDGVGDCTEAAALCAAFCHDAFLRCAGENIQIHGGIGFTWEHEAHLYYKRAQANCALLGDDVTHRRALATSLGLPV